MLAVIPTIEQHAAIVAPILIAMAGLWVSLHRKIGQVQVLVNGRLLDALARIAALEAKVGIVSDEAAK